jgi:SAM-dependent methyltransferase
MRLNDEGFVRGQYASTDRLRTRISVWHPDADGRWPQDVALDALRERRPRRVLEVGCGTGQLAARIVAEAGCELIAIDQSPEMVAAARAGGVDARVGDVQQLPFDDGGFDCAVAAWMLYHVTDLDRGLAELARVLVPGGLLVAITNGDEHLAELYQAVAADKPASTFSRENGEAILARHFVSVTRVDMAARAVFPDRAAVAAYLETLERGELADRLGNLDGPLVASGAPTVFLAETAGAASTVPV